MLEQVFCPYCAFAQKVFDVLGHKQCVQCGINVSPCCSGEQRTEYEIDDVVSNKKITCLDYSDNWRQNFSNVAR
jgi:primosomal protein N'